MKKTLFRNIQFTANIAIIFIAIFFGIIVVKQFLSPTPNPEVSAKMPTVSAASTNPAANIIGKTISLENIDWTTNKKTLVLYISNTCHFCSESSPFYQRLVKESAEKGIKLIAVLPQPVDQGREYLKKLEVKIDDVYQSPLDSVGVRGTPTLLLANEKGIVTSFWVGKLTSEREEQVISKLTS